MTPRDKWADIFRAARIVRSAMSGMSHSETIRAVEYCLERMQLTAYESDAVVSAVCQCRRVYAHRHLEPDFAVVTLLRGRWACADANFNRQLARLKHYRAFTDFSTEYSVRLP